MANSHDYNMVRGGGTGEMLIIFAGLPGSGKTTLASAVARELPAHLLSKDDLRALLFADDYVEYSRRQDDFCMRLLYQTAAYLFQHHPGSKVIVDGRTFSKTYQVQDAIACAEQASVTWRVIECACPEQIALQRIARDRREGTHVAGNRGEELYRKVKKEAEPLTVAHLRIDTCEAEISESVSRVLGYCRSIACDP